MPTVSVPTARENVLAMAAEARSGRTPPLLAELLRAQFPEPKRGWLARRLFPPRRYDVRSVEPFEDDGFFRATCVFTVFVRDTFLEGAVLPAGGTYGLFALGEQGVRYLQRRQENLESLLREEARPLDECRPLVLARLLSEALGREKNVGHAVLDSAQHLANYQGEHGGFGGKYELDAHEWSKIKDDVADPTLSGTTAAGWQLRFCTVRGWMHDKHTLILHDVRISGDYSIERRETILSRSIFSRVPQLIY